MTHGIDSSTANEASGVRGPLRRLSARCCAAAHHRAGATPWFTAVGLQCTAVISLNWHCVTPPCSVPQQSRVSSSPPSSLRALYAAAYEPYDIARQIPDVVGMPQTLHRPAWPPSQRFLFMAAKTEALLSENVCMW